jgi:hypothetical protein
MKLVKLPISGEDLYLHEFINISLFDPGRYKWGTKNWASDLRTDDKEMYVIFNINYAIQEEIKILRYLLCHSNL